MDEINILLKLLLTLFPNLKFTGIEKLQLVENIKIADIINLNLFIDFSKDTQLVDINHPTKKQYLDKRRTEDPFIASPNKKNKVNSILPEKYYSSGIHIRIKAPEFWEKSTGLKLRNIQILPANTNQLISLTEMVPRKTPRQIALQIDNDSKLMICIWKGENGRRIDLKNDLMPNEFPLKNSNWTITRYESNDLMTFETVPEIIISFDENIVKESILIRREHINREDEYYALILKKINK